VITAALGDVPNKKDKPELTDTLKGVTG